MERLGFGLMRLPLKTQDDQSSIDMEMVKEMVDIYMEKGFNYFDTAYMYHMGISETIIKEALVKRYPRESFKLANKLPTMPMFMNSKEDQERIFNEQLEKCGVEYFDNYLLHNMGEINYALVQRLDSFNFVLQKKKEGKIKSIGFSFHDKADLLDTILKEHPEAEFVQLQLNYMDWEDPGIQSRKCYEVARKHNKPIIVMEPVKGGILAKLPEKAAKVFKNYAPGLSLTSWAIRFAAGLEGVVSVLSGMSHMDHMKDNLSYMKNFTPLNQEEIRMVEKVNKIIKEAIAIPCTSCQYCVKSCPKNIAIPEYFSLYNTESQYPGGAFSIQQVYYNNYTKTRGKASDCINCKKCEENCPQHIEIVKWLKDVVAVFESA